MRLMNNKALALLLLFTTLATHVPALDNGLAATPPMGFNTWNHYRCAAADTRVRLSARAAGGAASGAPPSPN